MRPIFLACLCLMLSLPVVAAEQQVVYPAPESPNDVRHADVLELLHGALERTVAQYGPYRLRPSSVPMNKARQIASIMHGEELTVIWGGVSTELERDCRPIRIPLRKGLIGYRIALIAKERQAEFDQLKTADDLKHLLIGQGNGWADVEILRHAGFKVETNSYASLFSMVAANRVDLFLRGLPEVFDEYDANHTQVPNLAVEQHLVIHYDDPYYLYVGKNDAVLAKRLETGLRAMIKDGSFDEIFWRFHGAAIRRAKLSERRIIHIDNPLLSPETPLSDKSLWFDPTAGKPKG